MIFKGIVRPNERNIRDGRRKKKIVNKMRIKKKPKAVYILACVYEYKVNTTLNDCPVLTERFGNKTPVSIAPWKS